MTDEGLNIELKEPQTQPNSDWNMSGYNQLEINGSAELEIIDGEQEMILAQNDAAKAADVKQVDNKIIINTTENLNFNQNARFIISATTWQKIQTNGLHTISYHLKNSQQLNIEHNGNSTISGNIKCQLLNAEVNGLNKSELAGNCETLRLKVAGMGNWNSSQMLQQNLELESAGNSTVLVNAGKHLRIEADGNAKVIYLGQPASKTIKTSGLSSVIQKDK
jgi:hypothetical protein